MERNAKKTNLNDSLGLIGILPVKTHGLAIGSKIKAVCEKLEKFWSSKRYCCSIWAILSSSCDNEKSKLQNKTLKSFKEYKFWPLLQQVGLEQKWWIFVCIRIHG